MSNISLFCKKKLFLYFFLFINCTNATDLIDNTIINESTNISDFAYVEKPLIDTTIFSKCHIVCLETNDNSFIRIIDRIYKTNDYIFILDRSLNKVCIFDAHGKYINSIQHIGQGPNEYISLIDFCLDTKNNNIVLLCDVPYKLMRFDYQGVYINELKFTDFFRNVAIDSTGIYCTRSELNRTSLDEYEICHISRDTNIKSNYLKTRGNISNTLFTPGCFLTNNSNVYYTRRFDNSIYQLNDNIVQRKYAIDFGKYNLPEKLLDENDMMKFSESCRSKKYVYTLTDVIENDKYLIFNTNSFIALYNKTNKTFTGYPRITNTTLNVETNSFLSCGNTRNIIVSKLEPSIIQMIKEIDENVTNDISLFKEVEADDNPILLFYHIKDL